MSLYYGNGKKFLKKFQKKVLTNQSKCGIIIIENKERGKYNEELKCNNQL